MYVLGRVRVQASSVAPQPAKLKAQFFDLVIKGKFAISDLQAAVKSVVYNEDFKQSTIKLGGMGAYKANISNSRAAVREQAGAILKLNIPAQTKLWSNEQRLLDRQ